MGGAIRDETPDKTSVIEALPEQERNETTIGFERYKRWLMEEKSKCPVSGNLCIECGLFRGRHVYCSFFKSNLEVGLPQKEIERRRREVEDDLTAEKVWDIKKTPKPSKASKT
jgi:hypothetical protein